MTILLQRSIFCVLLLLLAWPAMSEKTPTYRALHKRAIEVDSLTQLPPSDSIVKLVNGTKYAVVIWDTHSEADYAYFSAMLSVSIPSSNQKLLFVGERIPFSNGSGIKGNARLRLAQDVVVNKGEAMHLTFKANDTYADIDCNGFQSMSLAGSLELSRNYALKENADGSLSDERVSANFAIATKDFSECLLKLSLPTFQIKGLKDFSFTVTNAYLDFSDYANPPGLMLSSDYDSTYTSDSTARLWQGLFLEQLKVKLPKFVKKGDGAEKSERLELFADGLLLDEKGFTGGFGAGNLLSLEKGNLGGWSFSLERLRIQLFKNQLTQGLFTGKLVLPITGKADTLGYKCGIGLDDSYLFEVNLAQKQLAFPMLKATQVSLFPASGVRLQIKGDDAKIRANLSGMITLGATFGAEGSSDKLALDNVRFEGLQVANYEPYIALAGIEYTNAQKGPNLSGFPLTINSIGFRSANNILALSVNMGVNFTSKITATGGLTVRAKMDRTGDRTKFTFMDVGLDALAVKAEVTKVSIEGSVVFFKEEPIFGNGFKGNLRMSVDVGAAPIKVEAGALFGRIGNHRYWFADASASGFRIPIFTGVVITGFAGGAYQGMNKSFTTNHPLSVTLSGQRYLPDSSKGMGFQAGVTVSIPDPKAIQAKLMLELAFNKDASLNRIFMLGEATVMDIQSPATQGANELLASVNQLNASALATSQGIQNDIPILKHFSGMDSKSVSTTFGGSRSSPPALKAAIQLDYNFSQNEFLANFKAFINLNGGAIRGAYDEGYAGPGALFISEKNWNLKFGTPSDRIAINVLGLATFSAYLMVGTEIEGSPAPPAEISRILGLDASSLDYMRDLNALGNGKGFAFGADFKVETGDRQFLIFYYRVNGGLGFDVMLKDYGKNAYCEGRSGPLGINGWYANGQAYAYFQGSVGINVKLGFIKGRYEIISVGAAAILQAKLPNPTWAKGIIGGHYSILNGLVSGSCRIEAEFGEECIVKRQGNELAGIDVISGLTPDNGKTDVSVFVKPQALFNIPVNEKFEFTDEVDPSRNKTFRAKLEEFSVREKSGASIIGEQEWNKDNTIVAFGSTEILPPKKEMVFTVKIVFEEYTNGVWNPYRNDKGQIEVESRQISFTTGVAPENIPMENIEYAYPAIGQKNLFKEYGNKGYLQLKRGQSYLFTDANSQLNAKFEVQGSMPKLVNAAYAISSKRIDYQLPELPANTVFDFALVNTPNDNDASLDKNVKTSTKDILTASNEGSSALVTTKEAEGELLDTEDKILLAYNFRSSAYASLTTKLKDVTNYTTYYERLNAVNNTIVMEYGLPKEPFDAHELLGTEQIQPLVSFDVDIKNGEWFQKTIKPLIYREYPLFGRFYLKRDTAEYGLVPTRHFSVTQDRATENLTGAEAGNGKLAGGATAVKLTGNFHLTMYDDFAYYQSQVANALIRETNANTQKIYQQFIIANMPSITAYRGTTYPVNVFYGLPGTKNKTKAITQNIVIR